MILNMDPYDACPQVSNTGVPLVRQYEVRFASGRHCLVRANDVQGAEKLGREYASGRAGNKTLDDLTITEIFYPATIS